MMMSCAGCSKLVKCGDAPKDMRIINHTCDSWETTSSNVIRARENVYIRFGPVARQAYSKERKNIIMQPNDIISNVQAGNVDAIRELRDQPKLQPTSLMLAAAKLTGDAAGIAAQLRDAKSNDERLSILIEILEAKAIVISESKLSNPEPAQEEPAPKKRRSRRKKVVEEDSVKEIEEAKAAEAETVSTDNKTVSLQDLDLSPLKEAIEERSSNADLQHINLCKLLEKSTELTTKKDERDSARFNIINAKLDMIKDAFIGFEIELIGSGAIGDTPFAKATSKWDNLED
jgi:hypothetical protein